MLNDKLKRLVFPIMLMIIAIIVAAGITSCSGNPGELSFTVTYVTDGNGMIEG